MSFFPSIYEAQKSIEVCKETEKYFEIEKEISDRILNASLCYYSLLDAIPTTMENIWSGHSFPFRESSDELQVSFTLCKFGLYKQAMCSLRSALELGLLSVYYNINNEGHKTVKKWLRSADTNEANTPRFNDVWKIIAEHPNIQEFQNKIDLKKRILELGYLHNYVHTKGHKFSNSIGLLKTNSQTFEKRGIEKWVIAFEEIVIVIITLHMLKYPTTIADFDYEKKFGIDIPAFPHIRTGGLDRVKEFLPEDYFNLIKEISEKDDEVIQFKAWINEHPDITEEQVEAQLVEQAKRHIENGGYLNHQNNELVLYRATSIDDLPEQVKQKLQAMEHWAHETGNYEPKFIISEKRGK